MILLIIITPILTSFIIDYVTIATFVTTRARLIILLKEWHLDY
jgi:hypothetical protein